METFALVRPAASNQHTGVYIYLDEGVCSLLLILLFVSGNVNYFFCLFLGFTFILMKCVFVRG